MKYDSLKNLEIIYVNLKLNDPEYFLNPLKIPIADRVGFKFTPSLVYIPRYYYRFVGWDGTFDEYLEMLEETDFELSKFNNLYKRFDRGLPKNIPNSMLSLIINCFSKLNGGDIDAYQIIQELNNNGLIPKVLNEMFTSQIKNNLKTLIDYYVSANRGIVQKETIINTVSYTVYWLNEYMSSLVSNYNYSDINPKILFYGSITHEEAFFLTLLSTLGFDILFFNPDNGDGFELIDKYNNFSCEVILSNKYPLDPFPEGLRNRKKTSAYEAKEELNKAIFTEDSKIYRPWQFAESPISAITLKTTYEEINIWVKENAFLRDGWNIENGRVYIPNIFAKISGTYNDTNLYFEDINNIISLKQVLFINDLPIIKVSTLEYAKFNQVFPKEDYSFFNIDKMLNLSWWKYKELRSGLQRNIAEKIRDLCLNPVIKNIENIELRDLQVEIFSLLITKIDEKFLQLLQSFDYPNAVPKIVVYNNERNGNLSFEDSILLTFLNYMGLDIIIYNPSGYNDIENYVIDSVYDIHRLEKISYKLDYKKPSTKKGGFFKKLFG